MAAGMQTEGEYCCATCQESLNIIGIMQHADRCERVLSAEDLSQSERSTLMYVETRVVDHAGELDPAQMNFEDQQNLKLFGAAGILDVEEKLDSRLRKDTAEVVQFTDAAWDLTRQCRQMRAGQHIDQDEVDIGSVPGDPHA